MTMKRGSCSEPCATARRACIPSSLSSAGPRIVTFIPCSVPIRSAVSARKLGVATLPGRLPSRGPASRRRPWPCRSVRPRESSPPCPPASRGSPAPRAARLADPPAGRRLHLVEAVVGQERPSRGARGVGQIRSRSAMSSAWCRSEAKRVTPELLRPGGPRSPPRAGSAPESSFPLPEPHQQDPLGGMLPRSG
jgi:hypothetical protein